MKELTQDLSVFTKLNLDKPPVGVKFTFFLPEGINELDLSKKMSLCEMVKEAQDTDTPFYFSGDHQETCVGKVLLGMENMAAFAESGQIGERLGVFEEARNNQRLYQLVPKMERGVVNYVAFSSINKINFEPDVLVISASPVQAEIIMRSITYSTGELYSSTTTPVMGCAWFLIYPYKTGKVNFIVPTMVHGLHGRGLWQEDTILISIPWCWLPTVVRNLNTMELHLPSHQSKDAYYSEFQQILSDLARESK